MAGTRVAWIDYEPEDKTVWDKGTVAICSKASQIRDSPPPVLSSGSKSELPLWFLPFWQQTCLGIPRGSIRFFPVNGGPR